MAIEDSVDYLVNGAEVLAALAEAEESAALAAHLADTSDAHDASAISYAGGTGMSATDVEAAIDELATEKANDSAVLHLAGAETITGAKTLDDVDLVLSTDTGTKIGTAVGQKLAFHDSTPVVQRAGAAQVAVATTATTQTTPFGFSTQEQGDALVALVNEIRAALVEKGLIKGAA